MYVISFCLFQLLPTNYLPAPSYISTAVNNLYFDNMSQILSRSQSVNTAEITAANEMAFNMKHMSIVSGTRESRPNSQDITHRQNLPQYVSSSRKASLFSGMSQANVDDASSNMADIITETGSAVDNFSDDESGNEADLDTFTEYTLPEQYAIHVPTREEMRREFARMMSDRLTQAAIMAGTRDNITVMVMLLPGCGL